MTELRFGVEMGFRYAPERLAEEAREAEALGFDVFSVSDHLHSDSPRYEPWTALTWMAASTERLTVLSDVLALPNRHPAVLAKMAQTLDALSHGRLILGLGTGGFDHEFTAFGLAERTPGEKLAALREAIEIMRRLWTQPDATVAGSHYHVTGARIEPRPARPIPIWLGAYGPRSLRLVGAAADGWLPSLPRLELDDAVARRERVLDSARAAGRDPGLVTCACNVVVDFDSPRPATPQLLSGSSEAVAEQLTAIVDAGFTCPIAMLAGPDDRARFAAEVIPRVRGAHRAALAS